MFKIGVVSSGHDNIAVSIRIYPPALEQFKSGRVDLIGTLEKGLTITDAPGGRYKITRTRLSGFFKLEMADFYDGPKLHKPTVPERVNATVTSKCNVDPFEVLLDKVKLVEQIQREPVPRPRGPMPRDKMKILRPNGGTLPDGKDLTCLSNSVKCINTAVKAGGVTVHTAEDGTISATLCIG